LKGGIKIKKSLLILALAFFIVLLSGVTAHGITITGASVTVGNTAHIKVRVLTDNGAPAIGETVTVYIYPSGSSNYIDTADDLIETYDNGYAHFYFPTTGWALGTYDIKAHAAGQDEWLYNGLTVKKAGWFTSACRWVKKFLCMEPEK